MRRAPLLLSILLSLWAIGCDDGAPPATTVTLSTDLAPPLVAFRDGLDGGWQLATKLSATRFEAAVTGPYFLTAVCEQSTGEIVLWQIARTLDDEREVNLKCDFAAPVTHAINGRMLQAGRVQMGNGFSASQLADWVFDLRAAAGTYDLMARTNDRVLLRRGIVVAGNVAVTPPLDVDGSGALLDTVAFTATNAAPTETVVASVHLDQPSPLPPFNIYRGATAAARVVPDTALAATDKQSVSIQATAGVAFRALRRPFRAGGNTAYTLPEPVGGVQWEVEGGNVSVSWTSAPAFDILAVGVTGTPSSGTKFHSFGLDLSPGFVAATGVTRATVDTELPGYKPEWKIDLGREYARDLFLQRSTDGELATSSITERLDPSGARVGSELPRGLHGRVAHP